MKARVGAQRRRDQTGSGLEDQGNGHQPTRLGATPMENEPELPQLRVAPTLGRQPAAASTDPERIPTRLIRTGGRRGAHVRRGRLSSRKRRQFRRSALSLRANSIDLLRTSSTAEAQHLRSQQPPLGRDQVSTRPRATGALSGPAAQICLSPGAKRVPGDARNSQPPGKLDHLPHKRLRSQPPSRRQVLRGLLTGLVVLGLIYLGVANPFTIYLLYVATSLLLGAVAVTTLVWMLYTWRTPDALDASGFEGADLTPKHSFSLIVPARHEEGVLQATLERLLSADHPSFELLVVVGDDDTPTQRVADLVAATHPEVVRVVVDSSVPKNKPKALNAALPYCSGGITGVFDAEDEVHPTLLRRVDQCFQKAGVDVVQAGVQLMNFQSSWFTVHNVLEYYFWFRSRLHLHARQRFIPLGGNTVFVRTELLREVGGWDPDCLAEDCELGVRLSVLGAHTAVFYAPELVTREECPATLAAFIRQRTRWNQGYLQTLGRGWWRRLPLRQRVLGFYILAMPLVMAAAWILIPVALGTAIVERAPVPITLLAVLPAYPMVVILAVEAAGLGDFCRTYGNRCRIRDWFRLVVGFPFYQGLLTLAAGRAVARHLRGVATWEKTEHAGLHRRNSIQSVGRKRPSRTEPAAAPPPPQREPAGASLRRLPAAQSSGGAAQDTLNWTRMGITMGDGAGALNVPAVPRLVLPRRETESWPTGLGGPARLLTRLSVDVVVQIPLLIGVALVQAINAFNWPATLFDEGTYVGYAWAVGTHGVLANYTYSYGHPPLVWILLALWTWTASLFTHATYSIDSGRVFMCVVTVISCKLLYTLARRVQLSPPAAALAVLLFALSPLSIYFHRAVLLDNPATAWALAAFVLALSPRRRLWAFALSGVCFGLSILSKETTLVMLPALVLAAYLSSDKRTRRYCATVMGAAFVLTGMLYILYATLKGELIPGPGHVSLLGTVDAQLFTRAATGSVFKPHSLSRQTVDSWLALDPWLPIGALVLAPITLVRRRTRAVTLCFLIQAAMILRHGYLPEMYVIALLPFAALIVAGVGQLLWEWARAPSPAAGRTAGLARLGGSLAIARHWAIRAIGMASLAVMLVIGATYVGPQWVRTDRAALTVRLDGPELAAEQWIVQHVSHQQRIIVTDSVWIYLITHGFNAQSMRGGFYSRTVVFFWPLVKDPAVRRFFPYSWREFDYIVATPAMRDQAYQLPSIVAALANSQQVVSFGHGAQRIQILAILPTAMRSRSAGLLNTYHTSRSGADPSLLQVAQEEGVPVSDLTSFTNGHLEPPSWWYYEGGREFNLPLPAGLTLYYQAPTGRPSRPVNPVSAGDSRVRQGQA